MSGDVLRHLVNKNKHTEIINSSFCGDKYVDIRYGYTYITDRVHYKIQLNDCFRVYFV